MPDCLGKYGGVELFCGKEERESQAAATGILMRSEEEKKRGEGWKIHRRLDVRKQRMTWEWRIRIELVVME